MKSNKRAERREKIDNTHWKEGEEQKGGDDDAGTGDNEERFNEEKK